MLQLDEKYTLFVEEVKALAHAHHVLSGALLPGRSQIIGKIDACHE
jgi:hypothetical protein